MLGSTTLSPSPPPTRRRNLDGASSPKTMTALKPSIQRRHPLSPSQRDQLSNPHTPYLLFVFLRKRVRYPPRASVHSFQAKEVLTNPKQFLGPLRTACVLSKLMRFEFESRRFLFLDEKDCVYFSRAPFLFFIPPIQGVVMIPRNSTHNIMGTIKRTTALAYFKSCEGSGKVVLRGVCERTCRAAFRLRHVLVLFPPRKSTRPTTSQLLK